MTVVARLAFVLVLVVTPIVVYATSASLPARVATHFASGGLANGWMPHDGYVVFMLIMSTGFPLLIAATTGLVPAAGRAMIRKYAARMSPARFEETVRWLGGHAAWVGVLVCLFFLGIHLLTVQANARTPARLDEGAIFILMLAFGVLLVIWIVVLTLRLPRRKD